METQDTMKVRDLIQELQKYDPEAGVWKDIDGAVLGGVAKVEKWEGNWTLDSGGSVGDAVILGWGAV